MLVTAFVWRAQHSKFSGSQRNRKFRLAERRLNADQVSIGGSRCVPHYLSRMGNAALSVTLLELSVFYLCDGQVILPPSNMERMKLLQSQHKRLDGHVLPAVKPTVKHWQQQIMEQLMQEQRQRMQKLKCKRGWIQPPPAVDGVVVLLQRRSQ